MQKNIELLKQALAKVLKEKRTKSISQMCNEVGISKSILSDLENAKKEVFLSTFWRISEALEIKPSELVKYIENELPSSFSFIED